MYIRPSQHGFTLTELLVSIAVFSIIIVAIYNVFDVHNLMAARQEENTSMQQELLSAMGQMAGELRMCGYATESGNFGITEATAANVACTREKLPSDDSRELDSNGYNVIAYRRNAADNTLQKFYANNGAVEWIRTAENIGDLQFTYFDTDGNQIPNPNAHRGDIRGIEINATAIPSSHRAGLQISNRTMSTRVFVRNIR